MSINTERSKCKLPLKILIHIPESNVPKVSLLTTIQVSLNQTFLEASHQWSGLGHFSLLRKQIKHKNS